MIRTILVALLALLPLVAHAQTEQQALVDRATLTVQEMLSGQGGIDARRMLRNARGALICPRVFKAGFILGGQGGNCILVGRANGSWSGPAFYGMGSGSVGLQIGIQDAEVIFMVMTDRGLQALLDSQFKLGADATVAVATIGGGVGGGTTAALRADVVAFYQARGLFAGLSLDGSMISARSDWNQAYYGQPMGAQNIVIGMSGQNPGAQPLQEMLTQFAGQPEQAPAGGPPPGYVPGPPQPPLPNAGQVSIAPSGNVSATPLAPPR
ncbi:MAG TPA: lipid-binding SYLF domain-containing protein [Acetobacteraceae bacterium]|jgi:lipid-binding SYLF domain-containing protein